MLVWLGILKIDVPFLLQQSHEVHDKIVGLFSLYAFEALPLEQLGARFPRMSRPLVRQGDELRCPMRAG